MELTDYAQEAAVLILLCRQGGKEHIVLTKRTEEVAHHKGQISFPGGAQDETDASLWETALREAQEEINLNPDDVTFIKQLSPRITPTRFRVTPFVGTIERQSTWQANPIEIAEIFTVPLEHLRNPENLEWMTRELRGYKYLDPCFRYGDYEIWGLTARVLCEFLGYEFPDETP